jgi:hypothetical protein
MDIVDSNLLGTRPMVSACPFSLRLALLSLPLIPSFVTRRLDIVESSHVVTRLVTFASACSFSVASSSSTNPELCRYWTGHGREQPSSHSLSAFRLLFVFSLLFVLFHEQPSSHSLSAFRLLFVFSLLFVLFHQPRALSIVDCT